MQREHYNRYKEISRRITKGDERYEDLLHDVLLQLSNNAKYTALTDTKQNYFFVRTLTNQYHSNNSIFQRTYKKFKFEQINNTEVADIEYKEQPTIEWIKETLDKELYDRPDMWYEIGLFKMFMEYKKIEPLHKRTQIPKYSIRNTIKQMKIWLRQKWNRENAED